MIARKKPKSPEEKYKFIAYILNEMMLPAEHRQTENKVQEKKFKKKTPKDLGPKDTTVHTRERGCTVQLCGDNNVACKWINGEFAKRTEHTETIGNIQRLLHSWWKKGVAKPISNIDSFVNHVYKEHDQEADHWANLGAQRRRKIGIYRRDDPTKWKARRGFWDGSFKDNGRSGCGIVI